MPGGVVATVRAAVQRSLCQFGLPSDGVILAAVSGGQDSVCLLDALVDALGRDRVVVGHLDHRIRGSASRADTAFVQALAQGQGCRWTVRSVDVPGYARHQRIGLEEAGRIMRYRALAAMAARHDAWAIATGHTEDDVAETLLINIVRGTGTTGEQSIHPNHKIDTQALGQTVRDSLPLDREPGSVRVVRPLLSVNRAATEQYCRVRGLDFRVDPTNLDPTFLRNRVRHHLLPLLRTYNPAIVATLARQARLAAGDEAALELLSDDAWRSAAKTCRGAVTFEWSRWSDLQPAVQRRLLRRAGRELGIITGWSFDAVESARLLLAERPAGRRLTLAGAVRLVTSRSGFCLSRRSATADSPAPASGSGRD